MEIEECKQISILDVASRLGISFKQVSSSVYEHTEHVECVALLVRANSSVK